MASYSLSATPSVLPFVQKEIVTLEQKMAAIQIVPDKRGRFQLGLFTHLSPGSRVELCGAGFNERTARIRSGGSYYMVLRKSIPAL